MKLSEAIRIGSKISGQYFGLYKGPDGKTCALGAAFSTVDPDFDGSNLDRISDCAVSFRPILSTIVNSPCECLKSSTLGGGVVHLNDDHKWSREAIAEWVEVVEKREEAKKIAELHKEFNTPCCQEVSKTEIIEKEAVLV